MHVQTNSQSRLGRFCGRALHDSTNHGPPLPFLPMTEETSAWETTFFIIGVLTVATLIFVTVVISKTSKAITEWDTYGAYGDARQLAKTTRNQPPPEDQPLPDLDAHQPLPDLDAHEEASAMSPEPLSAVTTSPQTTQYGSGF